MEKQNKKFQIKLPIETANLEIIRDFVASIAQNMGFSDDNVHRIELAVDEASTNVIRHAYKGTEQDKNFIVVEVKTFPNRLEIDVIDQGKGFDPNTIQVPEMDVYLQKMKRGGLGLYLIKTLMDKVEYKIKPGIRNRVRMVKYKPQLN